jgi:ribonuclease-3
MENSTLLDLQKNIDYPFKQPDLLDRAMRHSSAVSDNNQRLEFLGDAVLELVISEYLFHGYTQYEEGMLTKLRAAIVTECALAHAAELLNLGDYILFGKGEQKTRGNEKPSILSDAFEALIGAIYLDGGYEPAKAVSLKLLQTVIEEALAGKGFTNYKSALQEHFNKNGVYDIKYTIYKEEGPQHDKIFHVRLCQGKTEISTGKGKSKKQAEQDAARIAIDILNIKNY